MIGPFMTPLTSDQSCHERSVVRYSILFESERHVPSVSPEPNSFTPPHRSTSEAHGAPTYQPGMTFMTKSPQQVEADKHAQMSLIFAIVGIFVLGIVFGPLAIWQANKAENLGAAATAGKVIGWIVTIFSIIAVVVFLMLFLGMIGMSL